MAPIADAGPVSATGTQKFTAGLCTVLRLANDKIPGGTALIRPCPAGLIFIGDGPVCPLRIADLRESQFLFNPKSAIGLQLELIFDHHVGELEFDVVGVVPNLDHEFHFLVVQRQCRAAILFLGESQDQCLSTPGRH